MQDLKVVWVELGRYGNRLINYMINHEPLYNLKCELLIVEDMSCFSGGEMIVSEYIEWVDSYQVQFIVLVAQIN